MFTKKYQRFSTTAALNAKIGEVENKIPGNSGLVISTFLNKKIGEVENNKIPDHPKYITTSEFNEFSASRFNTKLKQGNLATNSDVDAVSQCVNKSKEKTERLQTFNLSYFVGKSFFGCF